MKKDLFVNKISKKGERRETKHQSIIHHPSSIINHQSIKATTNNHRTSIP
jgi:hypothetical protein